MIKQLENRILSSFALFADNKLCSKGQAFDNVSGQLFPANKNLYNNYYTYAAPYEQWVGDTSITGANVATGVYLNGNFCPVGVSGLAGINYEQGQAYFSSALPSNTQVSASYSVKQINVYLTDQPDNKLLFDTKFAVKPRKQEGLTGFPTEAISIPAIFLKIEGGKNEPFCLGGIDKKITNIRGIIIQKSAFELDATSEILKNMARLYVPLVDDAIPFGALGYTGRAYNFLSLATGVGLPFIQEAEYLKSPRNSEFKDVSWNLHKGIIDFELHTFLDPRT